MIKKEELELEKQEKIKSMVLKKIDELIYIVSKSMPFYASILSKFKKKVSEEIPIAAVTYENAYPLLLINPKGFMSYSQKERVFIFIHEIMHITSLHHFRMEDRDPGLWNIACDVEINQLIEIDNSYRPIDALMPHHFDLPTKLSAEEYYNILDSREEPIELPDELKDSLMDDIVNGSDSSDSDNGGDGDDQDSGEGDPSDSEGESGEEDESSSKAPGFDKLHPQWDQMSKENKELHKGLAKHMVQEAMIKSVGNTPGEMKHIIDELFEPTINWDKHLRNFANSVISVERKGTWNRPNRKFGSIKMGKTRDSDSNLLVAIDTSASLNEEELAQFLSEIDKLQKTTDVGITVAQCDTRIQSLEDWTFKTVKEFEVKGRGGTDFRPIFDLIKNRERDGFKLNEIPDGVIYLTDGGGPAPSKSPINTLWVLSPNGHKPIDEKSGNIDWGSYVEIQTKNN